MAHSLLTAGTCAARSPAAHSSRSSSPPTCRLARSPTNTGLPPVVQRFLTTIDHGPSSYRALRRLEVHSSHLDGAAWMNVWTTADESGFSYEIIDQGGSGYVRDRLFLPALESEREMWGAGLRGAVTPENYTFEDRGAEATGLAWIGVKPRRKDVLLVNGSIFLRPDDGDLVRIEGALSRTPSFWTRKVQIVRALRPRCRGARAGRPRIGREHPDGRQGDLHDELRVPHRERHRGLAGSQLGGRRQRPPVTSNPLRVPRI